MEVQENISVFLAISKRFWAFLLLGIVLVVGGISNWLSMGKNAEELRNSGVVTQAEIFRRDHRVDLSNHDIFSLTYNFQAPSPHDGKMYDYVNSQRVSSGFYDSIYGCYQLSDNDPLDYVKLNCEEVTIGAEDWNATVCNGRQTDYIAINVYNCEKIPVIYSSQDPNKSWISGTEPKSGWGGIVLMFFGSLALLLFAYLVLSSLRSEYE